MTYRNFHHMLMLTMIGAKRISINRLYGRRGLRRIVNTIDEQGVLALSAQDFAYLSKKVSR